MSWTANGFFRNATILRQLRSQDRGQLVEIYQPGVLNPASLREGVRYSGFITSLRLSVDITSIGEVEFPVIEAGMTEGEISAAMAGLGAGSPKKQLDLLLRSTDHPPIKVASIQLFNRRPFYSLDLLLYLTDATAFDLASNAVLCMQMVNVGHGFLSGADTVNVIGSAVEEGENTAPSLNITVLGGGGSGGGGIPPNAVTNEAGDVVTNNAGDVVTL